MNFLTWVLFGLIVGIVAHMIDPRPKEGGIIGAVILGVLGSILGGFLGNLALGVGVSGFDFISLSIAITGALLLLFVGRILKST